jgi:hypothetical protein
VHCVHSGWHGDVLVVVLELVLALALALALVVVVVGLDYDPRQVGLDYDPRQGGSKRCVGLCCVVADVMIVLLIGNLNFVEGYADSSKTGSSPTVPGRLPGTYRSLLLVWSS